MKRIAALLLACVLLMSCGLTAFAADGNVTYNGNAKKFIFAPGSEYSPTDLFPNFKDVMPGDSIEQRILLKNDVENNCKVDVFMHVIGGHPDSKEFLSQLHLTVIKNSDTVMFDAPADQDAQLSEWVYLGTLFSGGECELTVRLDVPVTLDNQFQDLVGYLDWEFAVRELPVAPEDPDRPEPPQTGDDSQLLLWASLLMSSLVMLMILLVYIRKRPEHD